jgi:hypothetical protein
MGKRTDPNQLFLITWSDNWADEMDLDGFRVMTRGQWKKCKDDAQLCFEHEGTQTLYFGTNEQIEYDSYDTYIDNFKTHAITPAQAEYFKKIFGKYGQGFFPDLRDRADEYREDTNDGQTEAL